MALAIVIRLGLFAFAAERVPFYSADYQAWIGAKSATNGLVVVAADVLRNVRVACGSTNWQVLFERL